MPYVKSIILAIVLLGSTAFAVDVTPTEKLGKLIVVPADAQKLDPQFSLQKLTVNFTVDKKSTGVELAKEKDVAAGVGCLEIGYESVYTAKQCGITIEAKKLTTIQLSAIKFTWDLSKFKADFGPQPVFSFYTHDTNMTLAGRVSSILPSQSAVLLIPAMNVITSLVCYETGELYQQTNSVAAGAEMTETIVTPEFRAKILLDFINGKPTFDPQIARNFISANYRNSPVPADRMHTPTYFRDMPVGSFPFSNGGPVNYYKFATDGTSQTIFAYPLKADVKNIYYEITINEHVIVPKLVANQTLRIPVATLNVFHYKTNIPGTFKVFSDKWEAGNLREHYHPDAAPYSVQETYFPTNSSLFFPIGYNFRLDFYLTDDFGRNTLQDQVSLDLTHE